MYTKLLIEQHFHGCYGIDFNTATVNDILNLAFEIKKEGIGAIFPTLVTDSIENIKKQISVIKNASAKQSGCGAKILGVHLEGIFINPKKKGIHNAKHFLTPTIENYKKVEDDFIKIVTLAPELCQIGASSENLILYLNNSGVKVQAGHCVGSDLSGCSAVTHTFNAMSGIEHRKSSTALSALIEDNIYTEIIADGVHVCDDALKLLFKTKPEDKILLISDCLPCTKSDIREFKFADDRIYYDGLRATSAKGTLAGSTKLLPDIIKILHQKGLFKPEYIDNPYKYHNISDIDGEIEWDEDYNIIKIK